MNGLLGSRPNWLRLVPPGVDVSPPAGLCSPLLGGPPAGTGLCFLFLDSPC